MKKCLWRLQCNCHQLSGKLLKCWVINWAAKNSMVHPSNLALHHNFLEAFQGLYNDYSNSQSKIVEHVDAEGIETTIEESPWPKACAWRNLALKETIGWNCDCQRKDRNALARLKMMSPQLGSYCPWGLAQVHWSNLSPLDATNRDRFWCFSWS